jgi:outer membrane protein TolC
MMRIISIITLTAFLICAGHAEEQKSYTLTDCLELSLSRSAVARNAQLDEAIAGAKVKQARSMALPHLAFAATYRRLDELQEIDFGDEIIETGTLDNYSVDATINQLLFSGGKLSAALNAAGITRRHAAFIRGEVTSGVVLETTTLFNNILLARSAKGVVADSVELLDKLVDQTTEMLKADKAAEFDLLRAQVRYENEIPQLSQAKNTLALLQERMKKLVGLDVKDLSLDGGLAFTDVELDEKGLIDKALSSRSLLHSYQSMALLRKEGVSAAKSDMLPSMSAFVGYNGANSYGFVSFGEEEWQWHWNAGIMVNWNVWDGSLSRGILKEKKLEHAKSLVDLDDAGREVILQVKSAILTIQHAADSVAAAKRNVTLAQKSMEIAAVRHEEGISTYLDYTDANLSLKRARLQYLASVCSHMNAVAALRHAVGNGATEDLSKNENGDSDE